MWVYTCWLFVPVHGLDSPLMASETLGDDWAWLTLHVDVRYLWLVQNEVYIVPLFVVVLFLSFFRLLVCLVFCLGRVENVIFHRG